MKTNRKLIAIGLALMLCLPVCMTNDTVTVVQAETVQEKINKASKEKQEALDKIKEAESAKDDVVAQSEQLNREIDIVQTEIFEIDAIIEEADAEIAKKEEEIKAYEQDIEASDEAFKSVLRSMDEMSTGSYLELLLSSGSLSEFLAHVETINEITQYDMAMIDEMVRLKTGVEEAKAQIEAKKAEQEEARSIASDKEATLQTKLDAKEALTKELEADIEKYKKVYEEARRQEDALKASIAPELSKSSDTVKYTGGVFCWPAPSYVRISSPYGYRIHPIYKTKKFHSGLDLAAPGGSNILAAADGVVKMAGWNGGYGNCVIVDHGGGVSTLYGHAQRLLVSKGQKVTKGQVIAKVGTTGASTGNHLHFEVLLNGRTTDPMPYLK